jgi:hypothetical protein
MKVGFPLLALPLLLSCSVYEFKPATHIARTSRDFDLQVEQAQNQSLLANVWRAKKRSPLYLTDISKVTGTLKRDITLGLSLPFGHKAGYQVPLSPSTTLSNSPTFDVSVLDTQDFMRGFLSPVPPETFAYYWRQAWPPELLLHLLVREITIYDVDPKRKPVIITNYPDPQEEDLANIKLFAEWAHFFQHFHLTECRNSFLTSITAKDFGSIDAATKAVASGLRVSSIDSPKSPRVVSKDTSSDMTKDTTTYNKEPEKTPTKPKKATTKPKKADASKSASAEKPPDSFVTEHTVQGSKEIANESYYNIDIAFEILVNNDYVGDKLNDELGAKVKDRCEPGPGTPASDKENWSRLALEVYKVENTGDLTKPNDKEAAVLAIFQDDAGQIRTAKLSLRSPEGVLYYLGELARVENFHKQTPRACINGHLQPIFVAYSDKMWKTYREEHPEAGVFESRPASLAGSASHACRRLLEVEDSEPDETFMQAVFIPETHDPNDPTVLTVLKKHPELESPCTSKPDERELWPHVEHKQTKKYAERPFPNKQETEKHQDKLENIAPLDSLQCNGGRSMHVLSLLSQLIALHKSAKDFPTTPAVKVIGQ